MKHHTKYLFLVIPLVMLAAMIFPTRAYAQDGGTAPEVPTAPGVPGSSGPSVLTATSPQSSSASAECTSPGVYGDPWFKVGLVTYYFLLAGPCPVGSTSGITCFISATPIQDAINWINSGSGALPTDKKIYVEAGTYSGSIVIDGSGTNKVANLVGLIGAKSGPIGSSNITGGIEIMNTKAGFTLSGFNIAGAPGASVVSVHNNIGALTLSDLQTQNFSGSGIVVSSHQGNITLNGIMSSGNSGSGAIIDNSGYLSPYPVTVKNSEFDDNDAVSSIVGLSITSKGLVSLDGVSASRNRGDGLVIDAGAINIKNGFFNDNYNTVLGADGWGMRLKAASLGATTLDNIYANYNSGAGVDIIANGGGVTISNMESTHNSYGGLLIGSLGVLPGAVKVTSAQVNSNYRAGVQIYSKSNVTLDTIDAFSTNSGANLFIDNCAWNGVKCLGTGSVTVSSKVGSSFYYSGTGPAIQILSGNKVSLSDFTTFGNSADGVLIDNTHSAVNAGVVINSTLPGAFRNTSSSASGSNGVAIYSNGFVSVNRLDAGGNGLNGLVIRNDTSPISAGMEIKNSTFNTNAGGSGLYAVSKGSIALTNVGAYSNLQYGLSLNNTAGYGGVTMLPLVGVENPYFGHNGNYAISVFSRGAVSLKGFNIYQNPKTGIYIDNMGATSAGVTVANGSIQEITTASQDAVIINSNGAVTISNVGVSNNAGNGIVIYNASASLPAPVSVLNSYSNHNDKSGLIIYSRGNVTLTSVSANNNGLLGVNNAPGISVDTCYDIGSGCTGVGSVTMNGSGNQASNNTANGLAVSSKGNIFVSNIYADNNSYQGLMLYGAYPGAANNITVTSTGSFRNSMNYNGFWDTTHQYNYAGLEIRGKGNIIVERTDAYGNAGYGMLLDNFSSTLPKSITVKSSSADSNQYGGMMLNASGAVILQDDRASNNSLDNSWLYMNTGIENRLSGSEDRFYFAGTTGLVVNIEVKSTDFDTYAQLYDSADLLWVADDNSGGGTNSKIGPFTIPADGTYYIKVTSLDYGGNYSIQLYTTAPYAASPSTSVGINVFAGGNVSVMTAIGGSGTYADSNAASGIQILTSGSIIASSLSGSYNSYNGVYLNNASGTATAVKLVGGTSKYNDGANYQIDTTGPVDVSGLTAIGSYNSVGIAINNASGSTIQPVTVTNVTVEDNNDDGLSVYSKGNITVNGIVSRNNLDGVSLNNLGYPLSKVTVLGTTRSNLITYNSAQGLTIHSNGAVSVDKVIAFYNYDGIQIQGGSTLTLSNLKIYYNDHNGIDAIANGLVTVTNVQSIDNGTPSFAGDGIKLAITNDPVKFSNSLFIGNHGAGIELIGLGSATCTLVSTSFYGNNTNNVGGIFNFWSH